MTKIDRIESILLEGKKITPLSAIQVCGAMRLADTVFQLKKRGHDISTTIRTDTQGCVYAEYRLIPPPIRLPLPVSAPMKLIEYKPLLKAGSKAVVVGKENKWGHCFPIGTVVKLIRPYHNKTNGNGFDCKIPGKGVEQCIPSDELRAV